MHRNDDFSARRKQLTGLSDEELKERFWNLTQQVVEPLLKLAQTNTSPSIERSVLLRMGFTSLESQPIVDKCVEHGLLGKGAGHVVWRVSQLKQVGILEAGRALAEGKYWEEVKQFFRGGNISEAKPRS